jgi:hypothetical protein
LLSEDGMYAQMWARQQAKQDVSSSPLPDDGLSADAAVA